MRTLFRLAPCFVLVSCVGTPGGPGAPMAGTTPELGDLPRPEPGADLSGPIAVPERGARKTDGEVEPLDLGVDVPPSKVDVPVAPRGAAAPFTFGDERRGWVTRVPEQNQLPSVAYGDGRVYVSAGFESIAFYALDAETGRFAWSSRQLEDNGPTAPIYDEGKVIFNTESCTLFVMEAKSGKKLWHKYLGDPTLAQPAVSAGLIYAQHPSGDGPRLSAYRVKDGSVAWSQRIDGEPLAAPVVQGGALYVSTIGGRLYRFDKKSGRKRWEKSLQATSAPWVVGDADGVELHLTRREGAKETQIVVAAADGRLLRKGTSVKASYVSDVPRTMANWKQVWAFEGSRPVVAGGVRYAAMGGRIEASDPHSGAPIWIRHHAKALGARSVGSVALAGPQVVISTRDGQIFGLDVDTGYTLWAYDLPKNVVAEPIVAEGWVYAATTDGTVVALNVADASLDGWHMWGGDPYHNGPVKTPPPKTASAR
jgi:Ca-activated chloride channel family protein